MSHFSHAGVLIPDAQTVCCFKKNCFNYNSNKSNGHSQGHLAPVRGFHRTKSLKKLNQIQNFPKGPNYNLKCLINVTFLTTS